ncbi:uridine-cytidine kinase 1 [Capsaspora owczarzaki ATCC 30864]|uniref:Uridine kinase n=1 Tax=Capsaspora owczarzaki (strain ATCC 30864) TaxID=595528 RepID=A0A0D2WSM8_CAPO3|nr:uridine-cytidine kinase 1 [Capsaspora owczarzaki ATCC 30864]KJE95235.1 uridine-cytidine kinase 1 [Capsaspora owczarzaki ATCC 30864]|eukprot:XP_004346385.1 uridine-cytidine kinase 1 [Capsaspora owczarzaki ATCC 30864]
MAATGPFFIGVAGGTASGKTTVCEMIMSQLGMNDIDHKERKVVILHQDSFYKVLTREQSEDAAREAYNFDHPDAFDYELIVSTLDKLTSGQPAEIPIYNFKTHSREKETILLDKPDVVLFEGILVLYSEQLRKLLHMKLFVDTDADTRLSRRVLRDIAERNRQVESVLRQYLAFVKPAFDEYILPTKKYADVIIPRGADNLVAINLISQHIKKIVNTPASKRSYASAQASHLPSDISASSSGLELKRSVSKDKSEAVRPH